MEHKARGQIFYDDDKSVIERQLDVLKLPHNPNTLKTTFSPYETFYGSSNSPSETFESFYGIEETINAINSNSFSKVALQFPDDMLPDAAKISNILKSNTNAYVYILGDTSYGSCCVDEVAAQHLDADVVIHYGRTCLSKTSRLPVFYVFGKNPIDIQDCSAKILQTIPSTKPIIIFYDLCYEYSIKSLEDSLKDQNHSFIFTQVAKGLQQPILSKGDHKNTIRSSSCGTKECCSTNSENSSTCQAEQTPIQSSNNNNSSNVEPTIQSECDINTISFCGRTFALHERSTENSKNNTLSIEEQQQYTFLWIGEETITLTNLMMSFNQSQFYS